MSSGEGREARAVLLFMVIVLMIIVVVFFAVGYMVGRAII